MEVPYGTRFLREKNLLAMNCCQQKRHTDQDVCLVLEFFSLSKLLTEKANQNRKAIEEEMFYWHQFVQIAISRTLSGRHSTQNA